MSTKCPNVFTQDGSGPGVLPSSAAILWIPTLTAAVGITSATSLISTPDGISDGTSDGSPLTPSSTVIAVGTGLAIGEELLPVPPTLQQKIIKLDFVEMRETWQREDDADRQAFWPKKPAGQITDILQWVQCFAALAGVLAKSYPSMVPKFMACLVTIVKCAHDFEGISWAQAYRCQVAQTKDLQWSWLNPTMYSLCSAGKAKRNVVCVSCLSDSHETASFPDNTVLFPWQGLPTRQTFPAQARPASAKEGPRCTYPA